MEKVSAIITTHNRLDYLKKAIASVERQSYSNIEIIVVDDCSSDGTKEFCSNKSNITYIYISPENHKNGNYARNLGIKNSTGEYIAFLDDDDEWMETKIEKQVAKMQENTKNGAIYCGRRVEVNDGELIYDKNCKQDYKGDCAKKSLYGVFSTTSAMLFKRKALEDVDFFDEKVNYWQETELMMRIAQKYYVDFVDELLLLYRQKFKDKHKLTNNVDGFKENYKYINEKHKELLSTLDKYEMKRREKLYNQDLAERYSNLHHVFLSRKHMFKIFMLFPSVKNFAKFLLNYTNYTKVKTKLFIRKFKLWK